MASRSSKARRRANGEGSIYYVESEERWRAAIGWIDDAGKPRRRSVAAKTQADARRRLAALRSDIDRGQGNASTVTVAGFLASWLEADRQRVRPSTWRQHEGNVRLYIVPALGHIGLAKLQPADVERMTNGLTEAGKSPRTAAHARVILRRALADAERDGLVHRNAAALARPPRVEQSELRYLDPAQLQVLIAACAGHPLGPLLILAATTGLRQGELLGLAWSAVDVGARRLTVRRALVRSWDGWKLSEPKTPRSRRTIHLPTLAVDALKVQLELQATLAAEAGPAWQDRNGLVFTDSVGQPLRGYNVSSAFSRLLAKTGLPHISFHGLRHSAATALLAAGVPLRVVADQLGHSTIVITADMYAAVVPELRRDAANAMDRVLAPEPANVR